MSTPLKRDDALLVVDVQNDFLPGGSLAVPEGDLIIPIVNRYIELFTLAGLPVFASRDYHPANHCSFAGHGGNWPPHCIAETNGASFPDELKLPNNVSIVSKAVRQDKDAYSAMDETELAIKLKELGVSRIFVCGLATDYCVHASVLDLLETGYQVIVLTDGIRGVNLQPDDSAKAIEEMKAKGAKVLTRNGIQS